MLQKETIQFLEKLNENNTREWFTENKAWYERSRKDFENMVAELIKSVSTFDPSAGMREAKKCIFRIYKDTRFSKDKTPYKTNFGAVLGSKDSGYYIHVSADECFLACGYYMLMPDQLKRLRKGIYDDYASLREILDHNMFKKEIGDFKRDDDALQRVPNGYEKTHASAEYLKLKRFYVSKSFDKELAMSNQIVPFSTEMFKLMKPLKEYLNELVME